MALFNQKKVGTKPTTTNLAGGSAYSYSDKSEAIALLVNSFVSNTFYQSGNTEEGKIVALANSTIDSKFLAKLAIYARTKFGMRSSSQVLASALAKKLSGTPFASSFYEKIVERPDDMAEILSHYLANYGTSIPNAMRKGFKKVLESMKPYQIAKYKMEGKGIKLVDLVNLFHPKGNFKDLVEGNVKNTQTWEAKMSSKGNTEEGKKEVWSEMVLEGKLGYLALIRNIRNILNSSPTDEVVNAMVAQLTNKEKVLGSKVFPFQIATAYEELTSHEDSKSRLIRKALSDAIDISCSSPEMGEVKGTTCVMLDMSGSMGGKPIQIGSLFAGILAKAYNADVVLFGSNAQNFNYSLEESTMALRERLNNASLGGTNFEAPIELIRMQKKKYDRVIILSDMQSWEHNYGSGDCRKVWNRYKGEMGINPILYSFDLQSYGTIQFPEKDVVTLAGFSGEIIRLMGMIEQDKTSLVQEVEKIDL